MTNVCILIIIELPRGTHDIQKFLKIKIEQKCYNSELEYMFHLQVPTVTFVSNI